MPSMEVAPVASRPWKLCRADTAIDEPPKSAYVGEDEAQKAKQAFWDRYLGGGAR